MASWADFPSMWTEVKVDFAGVRLKLARRPKPSAWTWVVLNLTIAMPRWPRNWAQSTIELTWVSSRRIQSYISTFPAFQPLWWSKWLILSIRVILSWTCLKWPMSQPKNDRFHLDNKHKSILFQGVPSQWWIGRDERPPGHFRSWCHWVFRVEMSSSLVNQIQT